MRAPTRLTSLMIAVLVGGSALLGGCTRQTDAAPDDSANAPTAPATASVAPDGRVSLEGLSFLPPAGWTDSSDIATVSAPAVAFGDRATGASINVALTRASGPLDLEALRGVIADGVTQAGAQDVTVVPGVEGVDGEPALVLTALVPTPATSAPAANGATSRVRQYYVGHAGDQFLITVALPTTATDAEVATLAQSILATWRWTTS